MEPGSSISNVIAASGQLPGAVQDGVAAAKHDPTNPANPAKDPLDVFKKPTGGLTKSSPKPPTNGFDMKSGGKFSAGASSNNSSSPDGSKGPVRQIIGRINSALSVLANGQTHNEKKDSADTPPGPHSP